MVGYYATLADLHPCVRIASSATLRRRFAKKMKDIGFCYPCPPTLLLPMSPADQFTHGFECVCSLRIAHGAK